jgi:phosphopantothenoylcysteine decarboxylase/phosphopantothenate--cysteine ligase
MAGANSQSVFTDRRIIIAVTGGIACYKTATLVSRLAQAGAQVTVMMTESATKFIGPLTFQSLSGRPVYTSLWQAEESYDAQHIDLARSADLVIVAPATANIIGKAANGICDDLVSTVLCALPRATALLLAPAMNADMWANPIVQANLAKLKEVLGWHTIGPEEGWQACRTRGAGRMSEPQTIFDTAAALIGNRV